MRTAYSRLLLKVKYLQNYPEKSAIVELSSKSLPPKLLRTKEKECTELISKYKGKPQMEVIYEYLHQFIHGNMFVPCWREMKKINALFADKNKGSLGADEKLGLLQLKIKAGQYKQIVNVQVPSTYPEKGVSVSFLYSNFPESIQYKFKSQVEEIIRRCEQGFPQDLVHQV